MKIKKESIKWALKSLENLGDSDLFVRPFELSIIQDLGDIAVSELASLDLSSFGYGPSRRFIVPKDDLSYRTASQLDPLNSVLLTTLIYEYGHLIEAKRRSKEEKKFLVIVLLRIPTDNSMIPLIHGMIFGGLATKSPKSIITL
jgi:hypothetical protein